jgi:hypothetical protein
MASGALFIGCKSVFAVMTRAAVPALVERIHNNILFLLGKQSLHFKQAAVAFLTTYFFYIHMMLMAENNGFHRLRIQNPPPSEKLLFPVEPTLAMQKRARRIIRTRFLFIAESSTLHIKNIRFRTDLLPQHPHRSLQLVNKLKHSAGRIRQISENTDIRGTGFNAGRGINAFGQPGLKTEIAFINGTFFFIIIAGIVGAGHNTGFAPDAFFVVHLHDAVGLSYTSPSSGGAHARRIVALIAEDGNKFPFLIKRRRKVAF